MNENNNGLNYTYSAPTEKERREIENIKRQYVNKNTSVDKITELKNLHDKVTVFPTAFAISLGIVGTLLFGLGFSMILEWEMLFWGAAVSVLGLVPMGLSYFVYTALINYNKSKYGSKIVELSDQILNNTDE